MDTPETRRHARAAAAATAGAYWIPTRPYTLIDAVNRVAAATGSVQYAQRASDANYNGHAVQVTYNDYRGYCVCEHFWGGRVVHCRGTMEATLRAGRYEYDRDCRGTSVKTCPLTPSEAEFALSLGYIPWTAEAEEAWNALWLTELHGCVGEAFSDVKYFGGDTTHLLLRAHSKIDYHEQKSRLAANQLFGHGKWKECLLVGPTGQRALMFSGDRGGKIGHYAQVIIDGAPKLSGSTATARQWWENQVGAGWTAPAPC